MANTAPAQALGTSALLCHDQSQLESYCTQTGRLQQTAAATTLYNMRPYNLVQRNHCVRLHPV